MEKETSNYWTYPSESSNGDVLVFSEWLITFELSDRKVNRSQCRLEKVGLKLKMHMSCALFEFDNFHQFVGKKAKS